MRFFPAEPDISTIFNRILDGDIDLQPDFQRGEVWSLSKQQRLVDTILRGWIVPPILLVRDPSDSQKQQVLDGQQRLAAIRDFKLGLFGVDGRIKPIDKQIQLLHGVRYGDLPADIRKAFDKTPIRIYEVADYKPEEPAEIFYRLNQPTALTSAEKRNAFFGPVRDQIREHVLKFEEATAASEWIGFSNSRMAYDDVFAKFACTIELGTLRKKLTASTVNDLYRKPESLDKQSWSRFTYSINLAEEALRFTRSSQKRESQPKFNKATFYSWLVFICRLNKRVEPSDLAHFMLGFELLRTETTGDGGQFGFKSPDLLIDRSSALHAVLRLYTDRSTSRVADVSSVVARDFALWTAWHSSPFAKKSGCTDPAYNLLPRFISAAASFHDETNALDFVEFSNWGDHL